MEDIEFYVDKVSNILEKIDTVDNAYLKQYFEHRLYVYLNKLYDLIGLTIPFVDGDDSVDESSEDGSVGQYLKSTNGASGSERSE